MDEEEVSPVAKAIAENKEKKRAHRAKVKTPDVSVAEKPEEEQLTVEVKNVEPQKKSLRERLGIGTTSKPIAPTKPSHKKTVPTSKLMFNVLPLLASSLIAAYCRDRLPEIYQPCAPTNAEVTAIITPLMDMLSRRVSVAVKMSQDAIDVTNALICTIAYGTRAYVTYVEIHRKVVISTLVKENHNGNGSNGHNETTPVGTGSSDSRGSSQPAEWVNISSDGPGTAENDRELRDREAEQVAELLRRDKLGRDKRGLI